ncbi:DegV family protein [Mycoplasma todarodis]|uniref:DegV family protein n=1 Tax=Mycoplasma todarodis TaxID=1937191 RepID=UPI003B501F92
MKKLGIILDSFCSRTKTEIEKLGFGYLSLQVVLDGKLYKDGEKLDFTESMKLIEEAADAKTSQPNAGDMEDLFKEMTKEYEKVVYFSLASGMSSAFSTASAIAADFDGKVEIWDNTLVGPAYIEAAQWISNAVNNEGLPLDEAKIVFDNYSKSLITWMIPERIDAIKRNGRAKKGAALLLSKFKIVPLISYKNQEIEVKGVRRGFAKASSTIVSRMKESMGDQINDYNILLMYSKDSTKEIMLNKLNEAGFNNVQVEMISSAIGIQAGIGSLSISAYPKQIKK